MENNKLSYISWAVLIGAVLILGGWFLTRSSNANTKPFSFAINDSVSKKAVTVGFEYPKDWNEMATDKAESKLGSLKTPKTYVLIDKQTLTMMGLKGAQAVVNQRNFEEYTEISSEDLKINDLNAVKIGFSYTDNGINMQACQVLVDLKTNAKDMIVITYFAPEKDYAKSIGDFGKLIKSISITSSNLK
ncbi:MAG: hypothetical protein KBB11_08100 [Bacteroidales bacterium]|nr:hypothetical protein [Bacteroidales bacterium]